MKALIVDDSPVERTLLRRLLAQKGWETAEAGTGREAMERFVDFQPDLVVSDAMMPDMDGFQLLREIRRRSTDGPAFVMYSGVYTAPAEGDLALSLGADAIVQKNRPPSELIREIETVMERRRRGAVARPYLDEETYLRRYGAMVAQKLQEKVSELETQRLQEKEGSDLARRRRELQDVLRLEADFGKKRAQPLPLMKALPEEMQDRERLLGGLTRPLDSLDASARAFRSRFPEMTRQCASYLENIGMSSLKVRRLAEEIVEVAGIQRSDAHQPLKRLESFCDIFHRECGTLGNEATAVAETMYRSCMEMKRLVYEMIDLLRVATVELTKEPVDLTALAQRVVQQLAESDPGRTVVVHVEEGCMVNADPHLMRILLENLLENAWKFTRDVPRPDIAFGRMREESGTFFVKDNGAGFDPADRETVFLPFARLAPDSYQGTGIGLATVRTIVLRHGGTCRAEGAPQQGAEIIFAIPGG